MDPTHLIATVLSKRERDILALMAAGWTNRAISRQMWLSPRTVESHVRSIFMKLNLRPGSAVDRRVVAVTTYLRASERTVRRS